MGRGASREGGGRGKSCPGFTQLVAERIEARELEDLVTELETNTEGGFPLIDRSAVGGLPLIPEHGGHDR